MNFRFDLISFIIGMAVASLVWWVLTIFRPTLEHLLADFRSWLVNRAQKTRSGLEETYLEAVFKQTQGMHLAASLFALDEIIETPRLLAPPLIFEPNTPHPHQDIVEQALPYLPNYPELGSFYDAPTLTLSQALSGGMHLALVGQPGTGKTTALAYIAAQISKSTQEVKVLDGLIPFLIHVADLGLPLNNPKKSEDFLKPIIEKFSHFTGFLDASRLQKFVELNFTNGRALLLLDGVDELPQKAIQDVHAYLRVILLQYPKIRVVITGAPEYLDGILSLGFSPLSIMPWGQEQQTHFLKNWADLWQKYVAKESWAPQNENQTDTTLLNRWLSAGNFSMTPMEYTLKIWGAYAGDIRSSNPIDTIQAHISRLAPTGIRPEALSPLGLQAAINEVAIFDGRRANEWMKLPDLAELNTLSNPTTISNASENIDGSNITISGNEKFSEPKKDGNKASSQASQVANAGLISALCSSGLLIAHSGNRYRFSHPIFLAFLAGMKLGTNQSNAAALLDQSTWVGQTASLRYMAAFGDVTDIVNKLLNRDDPILKRNILTAGSLFRDTRSSDNTEWQDEVISALEQIMLNDDNPIGLRGEAMVSLALRNDNKIKASFRQMLLSPSNELRQLAALGAGILKDTKAVEALASMTKNSLDATRCAACLALVEIGTPQALEAVAIYLLHGDEQLRIYSAEALANHPTDGQEALREGINSEDILVRRAIVFGLSRVDEPWATELLEKTQIDDEQWVVRNLAVEFLTAKQNPDPHIPKILPAPHQNPWLIEFAGKYGMGVIPGQPAVDIFLLALKDPNKDLFKPALRYLRNSPTEGVLAAVYPYLFGVESEAKEAVFQTLAYIALSGTPLPETRKFGLG